MTNPTNTENAIQNAQAAAGKQPQTPASVMRYLLNSKGVASMLQQSLQNNAGQFVASVIDLYGSDEYLQNCQPSEVLQQALKAVSLKLPINKQLGFAWIVPRRTKGVWHPVFQIGYKGYQTLAMRGNTIRYLNAGAVYPGELKYFDKMRGIADISGERTGDEIVGFFAYLETLNGFAKCEYWTKEKLIAHASRYSDSYKSGAAIWTDNFEEMGTKTVLGHLLTHSGVLSVDTVTEIVKDIRADMQEEYDGLIGDGAIEGTADDPMPADESSGEVEG